MSMGGQLLPAEKGLKKLCRGCGKKLTVDNFYIRSRKMTQDGRWYRMSKCIPCYRHARNENRQPESQERIRKAGARDKAMRRLAKLCPDLFDALYQEELRKEGLI